MEDLSDTIPVGQVINKNKLRWFNRFNDVARSEEESMQRVVMKLTMK